MPTIELSIVLPDDELALALDELGRGEFTLDVQPGHILPRGGVVLITLNGQTLRGYVQRVEGTRLFIGNKNPIPN